MANENESVKITCKKCHRKVSVERTTKECPACCKIFSPKKLREIKQRFNGGFFNARKNHYRKMEKRK